MAFSNFKFGMLLFFFISNFKLVCSPLHQPTFIILPSIPLYLIQLLLDVYIIPIFNVTLYSVQLTVNFDYFVLSHKTQN